MLFQTVAEEDSIKLENGKGNSVGHNNKQLLSTEESKEQFGNSVNDDGDDGDDDDDVMMILSKKLTLTLHARKGKCGIF